MNANGKEVIAVVAVPGALVYVYIDGSSDKVTRPTDQPPCVRITPPKQASIRVGE